MLSIIKSGGYLGIEGYKVDVEIKISKGLPQFTIIGLPDTAVKESKERVKSSLEYINIKLPSKKYLVNLAPAGIQKQGTLYDLPIAVGILKTIGVINKELDDYAFIGELSLNAKIRKVKGILPIVIHLKNKHKIKNIIVPKENQQEASFIEGVNIYGFEDLNQIIKFLNSEIKINPVKTDINTIFDNNSNFEVDFSEVKGQKLAKKALEISAAGFHNLLMIGSPGSGKTMLAKRFITILPPLDFEEAIEITKIYSVAGLLDKPVITTRPIRFIHHSISDVALVGGGSIPKPGEISLAHNGVLFLDELPEFKRNVLETLRQPLEDGKIVVSRASGKFEFPANFILLSASNPCPCGYYLDPQKQCSCTENQIKKYLSKISGPLLDRIDLVVKILRPKTEELTSKSKEETSSQIKERVLKAVEIQNKRFKELPIKFNSQMSSSMVDRFVNLEPDAENILKLYSNKFSLTARSFYKILKVSRTIADLEQSVKVKKNHIIQAFNFKIPSDIF